MSFDKLLQDNNFWARTPQEREDITRGYYTLLEQSNAFDGKDPQFKADVFAGMLEKSKTPPVKEQEGGSQTEEALRQRKQQVANPVQLSNPNPAWQSQAAVENQAVLDEKPSVLTPVEQNLGMLGSAMASINAGNLAIARDLTVPFYAQDASVQKLEDIGGSVTQETFPEFQGAPTQPEFKPYNVYEGHPLNEAIAKQEDIKQKLQQGLSTGEKVVAEALGQGGNMAMLMPVMRVAGPIIEGAGLTWQAAKDSGLLGKIVAGMNREGMNLAAAEAITHPFSAELPSSYATGALFGAGGELSAKAGSRIVTATTDAALMSGVDLVGQLKAGTFDPVKMAGSAGAAAVFGLFKDPHVQKFMSSADAKKVIANTHKRMTELSPELWAKFQEQNPKADPSNPKTLYDFAMFAEARLPKKAAPTIQNGTEGLKQEGAVVETEADPTHQKTKEAFFSADSTKPYAQQMYEYVKEFTNASDQQAEWFAYGLFDEMATGLAVVEGITKEQWYQKNVAGFSNKAPRGLSLQQLDDRPVFYSVLQKVVDTKVGGKIGRDQLIQTLTGNGVKQDEISETFIESLFEGRDKVTKAEIQQHLKLFSQMPDVFVEAHPDINADYIKAEAAYEQARRALNDHIVTYLGVGQKPTPEQLAKTQELETKLKEYADVLNNFRRNRGRVQYSSYHAVLPEGDYKPVNIILRMPQGDPMPRPDSGHFETTGGELGPKTLGWARGYVTKDPASGEDMLVISEVQSNRHQKGVKEGYQESKLLYGASKERLGEELGDTIDKYTQRFPNTNIIVEGPTSPFDAAMVAHLENIHAQHNRFATKAEITGFVDDLIAEWKDNGKEVFDGERDAVIDLYQKVDKWAFYQGRPTKPGQPWMPLQKSSVWTNTIMKTALRWAVDRGIKKIAWATGEQNSRFNSKMIEDIESVEVMYEPYQDNYRLRVKQRGDDYMQTLRVSEAEATEILGGENMARIKGENEPIFALNEAIKKNQQARDDAYNQKQTILEEQGKITQELRKLRWDDPRYEELNKQWYAFDDRFHELEETSDKLYQEAKTLKDQKSNTNPPITKVTLDETHNRIDQGKLYKHIYDIMLPQEFGNFLRKIDKTVKVEKEGTVVGYDPGKYITETSVDPTDPSPEPQTKYILVDHQTRKPVRDGNNQADIMASVKHFNTEEEAKAYAKSLTEKRVHSVTLTPKILDWLGANPMPLYQGKQGAKAAISFDALGRAMFHMFKSADLSSMIHESFHLFEKTLPAEDRGIINRWLGLPEDAPWEARNEKARERVAYGGERAVRQQNFVVPPRLKAIFTRFATWMSKIYRTVKDLESVAAKAQGLTSKDLIYSKEVRAVFERHLGDSELKTRYKEANIVRVGLMSDAEIQLLHDYLYEARAREKGRVQLSNPTVEHMDQAFEAAKAKLAVPGSKAEIETRLIEAAYNGAQLGEGTVDQAQSWILTNTYNSVALPSGDVALIKKAIEISMGDLSFGRALAQYLNLRKGPRDMSYRDLVQLWLQKALMIPPDAELKKYYKAQESGDRATMEGIMQKQAEFVKEAYGKLQELGFDITKLTDAQMDEDMLMQAHSTVHRIQLQRGVSALDVLGEFYIGALMSFPPTFFANAATTIPYAAYESTVQRFTEALVNTALGIPKSVWKSLKEGRIVMTPGFSEGARLGEFFISNATNHSLSKSFFYAAKSMQYSRIVLSDMVQEHSRNPRAQLHTGAIKDAISGRHIKGSGLVKTPVKFLLDLTGGTLRAIPKGSLYVDAFTHSIVAHEMALSWAYRLTMKAVDAGVINRNDKTAIAQSIASLIHNKRSQAWVEANEEALQMTFHKTPAILTKHLQQAVHDVPWAILKFPFINFAVASLGEGMRKSPLGALNLAARLVRAPVYKLTGGKRGAEYRGKEFLKHTTEQIIAWGLMLGLGPVLFGKRDEEQPMFTGAGEEFPAGIGGPEAANQRFVKRSGYGNFQLNLDGKSFDLSWAAPFSYTFALTSDAYRKWEEGKTAEEKLKNLGGLYKNMMSLVYNQSYVRTLLETSVALTQPIEAYKDFMSTAAQLIPNVWKGTQRISDPWVREATTWKVEGVKDEKLRDTIAYRANPSGDTDLKPQVDLFGREVTKPDLTGPMSGWFFKLLTKLNLKDNVAQGSVEHKVLSTIFNYNDKQVSEEKKWWPGNVQKILTIPLNVKTKGMADVKKLELSREDFHDYAALAGEYFTRQITAFADVWTPEDPTVTQIDTLKLMREQAVEAATKVILNRIMTKDPSIAEKIKDYAEEVGAQAQVDARKIQAMIGRPLSERRNQSMLGGAIR